MFHSPIIRFRISRSNSKSPRQQVEEGRRQILDRQDRKRDGQKVGLRHQRRHPASYQLFFDETWHVRQKEGHRRADVRISLHVLFRATARTCPERSRCVWFCFPGGDTWPATSWTRKVRYVSLSSFVTSSFVSKHVTCISKSEDTSDSAYVRRHLEPEITERRHRVPEFISKGRRREHSKGPFSNLAGRRRNFRRQTVRSSFDCDVFTEASKFGRPDCHGDGGYGKREPSEAFEWSSISHHSDDTSVFHVDDKSLDGASWISATNACTSSDISADSALPRGELVGGVYRVKWTTCGEGDRPERSGTSIDSCSTASACSPLNSDLQLWRLFC